MHKYLDSKPQNEKHQNNKNKYKTSREEAQKTGLWVGVDLWQLMKT
jgi:hypothetical protein